MFITINGTVCEALKGDTVMQAARRNGIHIPGLCHHDALPGQACCRLCLVEILQNYKSKALVVSCVYSAAEGLSIVTDSPEITTHRKNILTMIRESAPNATGLSELYDEYGVTLNERFCNTEANKCMLCGLCVRACREMGASAISTNWRGVGKKVGTAFEEPSGDCVGCGACAAVCPTTD